MIEVYNFKEGDYIYCTKVPGIHRILRVCKESDNKAPLLITELLYNSKYERVLAKASDREYTVSGAFCKAVDLKAMLTFEQRKYEKVKTMIQKLEMYCN